MNSAISIQNTPIMNCERVSLAKQRSARKNTFNCSFAGDSMKNKNKSERIKFSDIVIAVGALLGLAFVVTCGVLGTKTSKSPTYWGKFKDGCKEMWKTIKDILDSL